MTHDETARREPGDDTLRWYLRGRDAYAHFRIFTVEKIFHLTAMGESCSPAEYQAFLDGAREAYEAEHRAADSGRAPTDAEEAK